MGREELKDYWGYKERIFAVQLTIAELERKLSTLEQAGHLPNATEDQLAGARLELTLRQAHNAEWQQELARRKQKSRFRNPLTGEFQATMGSKESEDYHSNQQQIFALQLKIAELEGKLKTLK